MLAFEVSLNGDRLYLAGIDQWGHMVSRIEALMIDQLRDPIRLTTSIAKSPKGPPNSLHWGTQALKVGDTVTVKIVEADDVDRPFERAAPGPGPSVASFPS